MALTVKTHKDGKKHFGWSCPAKPALIAPEPWQVAKPRWAVGTRSDARNLSRTHIVDDYRLVGEHVLELGHGVSNISLAP